MLKEQLTEPEPIQPTAPIEPPPRRFLLLRWAVWLTFVALWTRALLLPRPRQYLAAPLNPYAFYIAKTLHLSAYTVLAILSALLLVPRRYRWLLLVFMSLHAFATEYAQQFVAERHPALSDVGLDHIGIAVGILCTWPWWRRP